MALDWRRRTRAPVLINCLLRRRGEGGARGRGEGEEEAFDRNMALITAAINQTQRPALLSFTYARPNCTHTNTHTTHTHAHTQHTTHNTQHTQHTHKHTHTHTLTHGFKQGMLVANKDAFNPQGCDGSSVACTVQRLPAVAVTHRTAPRRQGHRGRDCTSHTADWHRQVNAESHGPWEARGNREGVGWGVRVGQLTNQSDTQHAHTRHTHNTRTRTTHT